MHAKSFIHGYQVAQVLGGHGRAHPIEDIDSYHMSGHVWCTVSAQLQLATNWSIEFFSTLTVHHLESNIFLVALP